MPSATWTSCNMPQREAGGLFFVVRFSHLRAMVFGVCVESDCDRLKGRGVGPGLRRVGGRGGGRGNKKGTLAKHWPGS